MPERIEWPFQQQRRQRRGRGRYTDWHVLIVGVAGLFASVAAWYHVHRLNESVAELKKKVGPAIGSDGSSRISPD